MIDLSTVKELRALRLPGMARELESQLEEPQRVYERGQFLVIGAALP